MKRSLVRALIVPAVAVMVSSCGGGGSVSETREQASERKPPTCTPTSCFPVSGTITGLTRSGLVLSNGQDTISVAANTTLFSFPTLLPRRSTYSVTVAAQPTRMECVVTNGSGSVSATTSTNVLVTCVDTIVVSTLLQCWIPTYGERCLNGPYSVAVDNLGTLFVADLRNSRIVVITPAGVISTLVLGDGNAVGVAVDSAGNLYTIAGNRILKIVPGEYPVTFAGSGAVGSTDGVGVEATFFNPWDLAVDSAGNLYVADTYNSKIRKITPNGTVTTLAGSGLPGSDDGIGAAASFNQPLGVSVDGAGNVYVADTYNHKVRKISPIGVVTTLAGSGAVGSADGPGDVASFNGFQKVAADGAGNVYVADQNNHKIRKISPAGVVSTLAGGGTAGCDDGPGDLATFYFPGGIAVDGAGTVFVGDVGCDRLRKITQLNP